MEKTEQKACFDFHHYRDYLKFRLSTKGASRGLRSRLAEELRCQSAYISRVLAGESDFSLEHAVLISRFLGHTDLEKECFLLLVHEARAGNRELSEFYRERRQEVLAKRLVIAERIQVKQGLSKEDQMTYYSAWHFAAIHVMLTVPRYQTAVEIAKYLQMPLAQVQKILDFLLSVGLAQQNGLHYNSGENRIHLGSDSPMISKHHTNWRMRAIQSLDRSSRDDLFYSGPISIAESDVEKIRGKILKLLEEVEPIFQDSKEECVYCLDLDFFRL
ncbi:MAG: TIGR02147 family protein [Bdellovibrionota bacterium]